MFENRPSYNYFRALHFTLPKLQGEDVFALQSALNYNLGTNLTLDGVLGKGTAAAINQFQKAHPKKLTFDGVAGQATQRLLAVRIAHDAHLEVQDKLGVVPPEGLVYGGMAHESSFYFGAYTDVYEDGSYDAGEVQRNTAHAKPADAFDPVKAIPFYTQYVTYNYKRYKALKKVTDEKRLWELAAGSWNRPAYADYYAGIPEPNSVKPGPESLVRWNAYIDSVTAYMKLP